MTFETRISHCRLNMVSESSQDPQSLATRIAIALAIIHWQAQIDAMDSEFVGLLSEAGLWVLDFD